MRVFIALEIPDDVGDALSSLEVPLNGARWVEQQDYHVTLRFIGEVEKPQAYDLDEALLGIDLPAFDMWFNGLNIAGGYDPRTIFAMIEPTAELERLVRAVDRAALSVGLEPDRRRAFRPHVTLARLKLPDLDRLGRFLERRSLFRTEPFLVPRFAMMSSKPGVGGGPYVVEQTYDLKYYGDLDDVADDAR